MICSNSLKLDTCPNSNNPMMEGLTRSSCNCLPDGGQCELLKHSKINPICENCDIRIGRSHINSTSAERLQMVDLIKGRDSLITRDVGRGKPETKCEFIGCPKVIQGKYCTYHNNVVRQRRVMWESGNKRWNPETWDAVPVRRINENKS